MKVRSGFVSNSSSTSFLIVGMASNRDKMIKLARADKPNLEDGFGGYYEGETLVFLGGEAEWGDDYEEMLKTYEPYFVGIEAEAPLKSGATVTELREAFITRAKALGVTVREDEVDLHFGEVSSE